jgi:hypothetical protein
MKSNEVRANLPSLLLLHSNKPSNQETIDTLDELKNERERKKNNRESEKNITTREKLE